MDNVPTEPEELFEYLHENELSDGLPVIPPTDERVADMLARVDRPGDELLLEIPTSFNELTVESLASCAVMAGCRPDYFPAVLAAFDGLAEWPNLRAVMATTSGFCPAVILNGPVRDDLDVNCGTGLFGPGYRANATIGRAVSLAFITVGRVYPGTGTKATHAHPGRYTYCFGEFEEHSPWDPLHTDTADLDPGTSAVTVYPAHSPHLLDEGIGPDPDDEDILEGLAHGATESAMGPSTMPGQMLFVLGQDHAGRLGRDYEKAEIQSYLYDNCRWGDDSPLLRSPADALVMVAGGIGNYSSVIHSMTAAGNDAATVPIPE